MNKHDGFPGLRFVTGNVRDRQPAFRYVESAPAAFVENLNFYGQKYQSIYCGWVLMPDHYHFLIYLPPQLRLSDFARDFRSMVARQVIDGLRAREEWRFLMTFKLAGAPASPRKSKYELWQEDEHVVPVGELDAAKIKLRYLHENPVRAGLVERAEEWPHSSAQWYVTGQGPVKRMMKIDEFYAKWFGWKGRTA